MRLLYWGDTPTVPTGFGNVALNILKRLYSTGKYDIDIVGINYGGDPYDQNKYPYKIYPAVHALATDANLKNDVYGYRKVVDLATTGRYDVIFILNDLFIVNRVMPYLLDVQKKLPKEKKFEIVYYFPVDSPVKPEWVESAVTPLLFPVTYTKYGINECLKYNTLLKDKLKYIYHGIDKNVFHPLSEEEIKKAKEFILGIHKDKYVVLNVNRNQARKDLHKTFASFKIFHEKYPNTVLFMLAQVEDVGGDLIEIAQHYGLEWDKDWICPAPGTYNTWNGYPVEVVNQLYNVADVVISTTLGEGWGLSTSEAFAAMRPTIFPNNTSLKEIIGENEERGYLVKSGATLNDWICLGPMDNNQVRPTIDVYDMADKLEYVYLHQEEAKEKAKRAYSEVWEWDTIIKQWFEIFDKAYNKVQVMRTAYPNVKRNDPCPCGSGKHYKNCCM